MGFYKLSALALLALRAVSVFAAADATPEGDADAAAQLPDLKVTASAAFPQSEIFGIKLVNGHATQALLTITNNEPEPIQLALVRGALSTLAPLPEGTHPSAGIVRNITGTTYNVKIEAGGEQTVPYTFTTDLHPQDLKLLMVAFVTSGQQIMEVVAYNETVTVVEAATSIFDPQIIFLYTVLLAVFAGTLYFVYKTWIETLFPQTRRGGKGGERAKRSSQGTKKAVDVKDQVSVIGADGPAVTTGAEAQKAYDESWIPQHHLQRPESKRVKSGRKEVKTKVVGE